MPNTLDEYIAKHRQILNERAKRMGTALSFYMAQTYPNNPKSSLESLEKIKTVLEKKFLNNPNDEKVIQLLADVNDKITNEDYLKPDTPDMEYATAFKNHMDSFVWPTQEELDIQAAEELELLNLKNSIPN